MALLKRVSEGKLPLDFDAGLPENGAHQRDLFVEERRHVVAFEEDVVDPVVPDLAYSFGAALSSTAGLSDGAPSR
ncbi:MAG: hypothetical protein A3F90_05600 [Deltaproteobacteria bacterium RIFCSPLOWO2_12_FULL_60_19]|nr:MAG: hypothetical protein A3F90_05600 [Deltaproteobacteria bacterium RIFCSPLOWO2_12_FULL_60_19]